MAQAYSTDHHEFDLNPDEPEMESAIEKLALYSDEPSADAGALPVWFLSQMTRQHVTVALSGEGADELFGGYETYNADNYAATAQLAPAFLRQLSLKAAQLLPVSDDKISFEYKLKRFLEGTLQDPAEAHLFWNGTFAASAKQTLLNYTATPTHIHCARHLPPSIGGVNRFIALDQLNYLPDDILYKCDRMSMAHSLEVRPPFLDHRIVEFAARLPENLKVHGSKLKYVLRELMRDKLPPSILTRKKQGFDIPTHDWLRTRLKPLLLDTVTKKSVEATGLMRWPAVERIISAHLSRQANYGYHLWGLLMLFLWIKQWNIQPHAATNSSSSSSPRSSTLAAS